MNFQQLRRDYQKFVFDSWRTEYREGAFEVVYRYILVGADGEIEFLHRLKWHMKRTKDTIDGLAVAEVSDKLGSLLFRLGVAEAINYWKLACPAEIELRAGALDEAEHFFWRKLFYKGLGEFIYLNKLHLPEVAGFELNVNNIVNFTTSSQKTYSKVDFSGLSEGNLVPVGGGKDSVVTLELLRGEDNLPMVVVAPQAAYDCIDLAGYQEYLEIERRLDPQILEMNQRGFLNGHVPFSAILAFVGLVGAVLTKRKNVVLSNENSANEPSVPGTDFNHQYSKSVEFEADFRRYVAEFVVGEVNYFSLLRPLEELEITGLFAQYSQYHEVFRSCNVGKKTNSWCGHCPKCLFVFIMLGGFLDYERVVEIFGKDLLADETMRRDFRELLGLEETKPFECVGTVSEVRRAMRMLIAHSWVEIPQEKWPILVREFAEMNLADIKNSYDEQNFVPAHLLVKMERERTKYGLL